MPVRHFESITLEVPLANGQTGLCGFASPPCLIPPNEATNFVVLGTYCDPWPYEDELP